jgi:hypothetical protein
MNQSMFAYGCTAIELCSHGNKVYRRLISAYVILYLGLRLVLSLDARSVFLDSSQLIALYDHFPYLGIWELSKFGYRTSYTSFRNILTYLALQELPKLTWDNKFAVWIFNFNLILSDGRLFIRFYLIVLLVSLLLCASIRSPLLHLLCITKTYFMPSES